MSLCGFTVTDKKNGTIIRESEVAERNWFLDAHGNLVKINVRRHYTAEGHGGWLSIHPVPLDDRYGVNVKCGSG